MRTILNAIVILLLNLTAWSQEIKTKEFHVSNYSKINVTNSLDVTLIPSDKEGVSVSCDERLLPAIKVVKKTNTLEIGLDWKEVRKIVGSRRTRSVSISKERIKINGIVFRGGINVTAYIKQIEEIKTSSSGDVEWKGSLPSEELILIAESSGDITWSGVLDVPYITIKSSSSGDIEGNIKAKHAIVKLSSSGDFEGNVEAMNLETFISSSADFLGEVNASKATFLLSSSGDAEVKGSIDSLYVKASSSADFYGKKIVYKKAEVSTKSSANIYLSKSGKVIDNTPRRTGVFIE